MRQPEKWEVETKIKSSTILRKLKNKFEYLKNKL
jgi:hypothetical protein